MAANKQKSATESLGVTKERIAKAMLAKIEKAKTLKARAHAVSVYEQFVRACHTAQAVSTV
jgi:predicted XRE-type DNA-binding protein